jgi:hypothetical protein
MSPHLSASQEATTVLPALGTEPQKDGSGQDIPVGGQCSEHSNIVLRARGSACWDGKCVPIHGKDAE